MKKKRRFLERERKKGAKLVLIDVDNKTKKRDEEFFFLFNHHQSDAIVFGESIVFVRIIKRTYPERNTRISS